MRSTRSVRAAGETAFVLRTLLVHDTARFICAIRSCRFAAAAAVGRH